MLRPSPSSASSLSLFVSFRPIQPSDILSRLYRLEYLRRHERKRQSPSSIRDVAASPSSPPASPPLHLVAALTPFKNARPGFQAIPLFGMLQELRAKVSPLASHLPDPRSLAGGRPASVACVAGCALCLVGVRPAAALSSPRHFTRHDEWARFMRDERRKRWIFGGGLVSKRSLSFLLHPSLTLPCLPFCDILTDTLFHPIIATYFFVIRGVATRTSILTPHRPLVLLPRTGTRRVATLHFTMAPPPPLPATTSTRSPL